MALGETVGACIGSLLIPAEVAHESGMMLLANPI
jgi:hypothetical protein